MYLGQDKIWKRPNDDSPNTDSWTRWSLKWVGPYWPDVWTVFVTFGGPHCRRRRRRSSYCIVWICVDSSWRLRFVPRTPAPPWRRGLQPWIDGTMLSESLFKIFHEWDRTMPLNSYGNNSTSWLFLEWRFSQWNEITSAHVRRELAKSIHVEISTTKSGKNTITDIIYVEIRSSYGSIHVSD